MTLEGVVTMWRRLRFCDLCIQDGLIHISTVANYFVKDPRDLCEFGPMVNDGFRDRCTRMRIALKQMVFKKLLYLATE